MASNRIRISPSVSSPPKPSVIIYSQENYLGNIHQYVSGGIFSPPFAIKSIRVPSGFHVIFRYPTSTGRTAVITIDGPKEYQSFSIPSNASIEVRTPSSPSLRQRNLQTVQNRCILLLLILFMIVLLFLLFFLFRCS